MAKLTQIGTPFAGLPPGSLKLLKYSKHLWYLAESVATGIAYQAFDSGTPIQPTESAAGDPLADEWRRWRCEWTDTISNDTADTQVFTFDVVNYTNGALDSSWTDTDHTQVGTAITSFVNAIKSFVAARLTCDRIYAYRMAFNPYGNVDASGKPGGAFAESGAPVWTIGPAAVGGSISRMGPQLSTTLTERTPLRPNWGRAYLPSLSETALSSSGRLLPATADAVVAAGAALVSALDANDFYLVVPTSSVNKRPTRTLQNVTMLSCDDVIDVQRRRRHHTPTYHAYDPIPAALDQEGDGGGVA